MYGRAHTVAILNSVVCKLLESVIARNIRNHLNKYNLIE